MLCLPKHPHTHTPSATPRTTLPADSGHTTDSQGPLPTIDSPEFFCFKSLPETRPVFIPHVFSCCKMLFIYIICTPSCLHVPTVCPNTPTIPLNTSRHTHCIFIIIFGLNFKRFSRHQFLFFSNSEHAVRIVSMPSFISPNLS